MTSGVCTALSPSFNIWTAIEPYAARLTTSGRGEAARTLVQEVVDTVGILARLPRQIDDLSTLVQRGRLSIEIPRVDHRLRSLEKLLHRAVSAVVFASLLLVGILVRQADEVFGWVLIGGSVLPLLHVALSGLPGRDDDR